MSGSSAHNLIQRRSVKKWQLVLVAIIMSAIGIYVVSRSHASAPLGVQPGIVSDASWGASSSDIAQETNIMHQAGVKWTRISCSWDQIEALPGKYNWSSCEPGILAARSAGINVLINVIGSPAWAQTGYNNKNWPPSKNHYPQYSAFVSQLTKHFAPSGVAAYEIWNEENIGQNWKDAPNAAEYTGLLQAAYKSVKAADSNATVVFGGTNKNDTEYLAGAYKSGAGGNFDVMATHPFANTPPEEAGADNFTGYRQIHQLMTANGDGAKKVWLTQIAWATCSDKIICVSEETQADYLTRAYNTVNQDAVDVPVAFWYGLRDNYWAKDSDAWADRLGLMKSDFTPKPAYTAYLKLFGNGF